MAGQERYSIVHRYTELHFGERCMPIPGMRVDITLGLDSVGRGYLSCSTIMI